MMTKKHFDRIAAAFKAEVEVWAGQGYGGTRIRALESVAARLANEFSAVNPRFDTTRFMEACGFGGER